MAQANAPLTVIREWQKKGFDLTSQSKDRILSLMTKAFETMTDLLSDNSDRDHILCSLLTLDSQRSIAMRFEGSNPDPIRTLVYGMIQSLNITLLELTKKSATPQKTTPLTMEQCTQTEIIDEDFTVMNDNPSTSSFSETESLLPQFSAVFPKPEQFDADAPNFHNEHINNLLLYDTPFKEKDILKYDMVTYSNHQIIYGGQVSREELVELDDEDDDDIEYIDGPSTSTTTKAKKRKIADGGRSDMTFKISATDMFCPECEYSTRNAKTWLNHLRKKHNTTPDLANVALQCECGHQCLSDSHRDKCKTPNFIVIRTRDGPIRRIETSVKTANTELASLLNDPTV